MATVKDMVSLMEEIAPTDLSNMFCEKYNTRDNSGLLLGDLDRQIFTVLVCLDLTVEVAAEAADINADMIISHHPFIFDGIKGITKDTPTGKIIYNLIKNDIAVYSAHLSFDIAPYGINQIMADKLGLTGCKVILPIGEDAGLGRAGKLGQPKMLKDIYDELALMLNEGHIKVCGNLSRNISGIAVVCGSGGGDENLLLKAYETGAELYITSEVKHHIALMAKDMDMAVIDAGHYSTEYAAMPVFAQIITSYAEARNLDIEVTESTVITNPFEIL